MSSENATPPAPVAPAQAPANAEAPPAAKADAPQAPAASEKAEAAPQEKGTHPAIPQTYKYKIEGKEVEVPLEEVVKQYAPSKVSGQRFREAAALRQQAEKAIADARVVLESVRDPQGFKDVAKALGINPYDLAQALVEEQKRFEALPPDQKFAVLAREQEQQHLSEKQTLQQQLEALKQERMAEKDAVVIAQYEQELGDLMLSAMGAKGIPQTAPNVNYLAGRLDAHINTTGELLTQAVVEEITGQVARDIREFHRQAKLVALAKPDGSELDDDEFIAAFGEANVERARRIMNAKVEKNLDRPAVRPPSSPQKESKRNGSRPMIYSSGNYDAWLRHMRGEE